MAIVVAIGLIVKALVSEDELFAVSPAYVAVTDVAPGTPGIVRFALAWPLVSVMAVAETPPIANWICFPLIEVAPERFADTAIVLPADLNGRGKAEKAPACVFFHPDCTVGAVIETALPKFI